MDRHAEVSARERSRVVWNEMAAGWESERESIWDDSYAVGEWLVRKLDPQPGDRLLELAAGLADTGFMAARLVGATGSILISDFAPEMVAAAQRHAAELGINNASFRVLDAEQMDLPTRSVDGVICRWGYMLMIDPGAALAETRRVLRPGGRLAFSVWATPEQNPWASLVGRIMVERGYMATPDPMAPGIFALSDPERLRSLVTAAGFADPEMAEVPTHRRFTDSDDFWHYLTELAGAISPVLRGLARQDQDRVRSELEESATPYARDRGYDFPGLCLNAVTS